MKNYCLVIICINKPFNCVIRLITIMIHNIRRNNSTIFNTDKLISLFDCIFDHFIWRETTFISLRQKIFFAQNFTHTVIKLSQFYKIFLFCISDNHRNLSLQLPILRAPVGAANRSPYSRRHSISYSGSPVAASSPSR